MELKLKRVAKRETYTIGKLYIDGKYFCDTIEDKDRGLSQSRSLAWNKSHKVYAKTAIPTGRYMITLGVRSPKFSQRKAYDFCGGCLPRLLNVPAFDGILIHAGNTAEDSCGCVIVGENKVVGKVINSLATLKKLYDVLNTSKGYIYITIE